MKVDVLAPAADGPALLGRIAGVAGGGTFATASASAASAAAFSAAAFSAAAASAAAASAAAASAAAASAAAASAAAASAAAAAAASVACVMKKKLEVCVAGAPSSLKLSSNFWRSCEI
jgi:hypothetical protein